MNLFLTALRHLLILSCCLAGLAQADSLATVRSGTLPVLNGSAPVEALLSLGGQPLAIAGDQAWRLIEGKTWTALPWPSGAPVRATAGGGAAAYVLRGSDRVEQLSLREGQLVSLALAPLPMALTQARASILGASLFIAGRDGSGEARLFEMRSPAATTPWQTLPGWPGEADATTLVGQTGALFLSLSDQRLLRWSADQGWTARGTLPGPLVAGSARAIGQAHVLYLLGSQLMSFQTITGSWAQLPAPPIEGALLSSSWQNGLLWMNADQQFVTAEVEAGKQLLKWLDWLVIAIYLAAMLGIGLYFYLQEKRNSTADFFVGGRSIPFWAAGVSLYATNTSSISFIAIPAKAFETNWQYLTNNLIAVVGLMFVAIWIVPLLRRLDLMSVFHYLETRFHPSIRMLASALCIVMQVGSRMSVVLFLPALAIATITGLDVVWSILIMGGFTIAYTALGGMKAVVWTDFVQVFAMMGGAVFAIGFIIYQLNGGFDEFWQVAMAENKTKLFDFSFDLTKATVWGFIFLVLFDVVLTFPKDQVLMQRTLSTKSDKEAGRSIWAFAAIMIPGGFVFYSIGTALYVYYRANPERMNPLLSIDATFPLFIAAELPMGVTGLIIAGIFAAAMSTLSSIINSVATLASVDFYEKLAKHPTPKKSVLFAECITVAVGLAGIGAALLLSRYDIHSLFDVSIELAGLLGGGFAGAYTLGMFTKRANSQGVAIGIACSILLTTIAWWMKLVHPYFYLAISIMLCIIIGYLASLLFPAPTRSLKGLTIYADDLE